MSVFFSILKTQNFRNFFYIFVNMKNRKIFIYNLDEISQAAHFILKNLQSNIILFDGEMGSGKTTLIKEIVQQLGVSQNAYSPTFSLVNEYETKDKTIFHFDLYRLKSLEEALDFGIEEYLYNSNTYNFIEWPEVIKDILPKNIQIIRIIVKDYQTRELQIS